MKKWKEKNSLEKTSYVLGIIGILSLFAIFKYSEKTPEYYITCFTLIVCGIGALGIEIYLWYKK